MICEKSTAKHKPTKSVLLIADQAPFEYWALDVVGPMPRNKRGKRLLITAIYYATRWSVAWVVIKHTVKDVSHFISPKIISRFVKIKWLITEGGF